MPVLLPLTSCTGIDGWDRGYRLRFWQKFKLDGETDFVRGKYESARNQWQEAVRQAEAMGGDNFRIGISLYDVAQAQAMLQQAEESQASLIRARKVFEHCLGAHPTRDKHDVLSYELANTLFLLGQMQVTLRESEAAQDSLQHACDLYASLTDLQRKDPIIRRQRAEAVASLAMLELSMDRRREAEAHFQEALPLAEASFSSPTHLENLKLAYARLMKVTARDDEAQQLIPDDPRLSKLIDEADAAAASYDWARQQSAAEAAIKLSRQSPSPQITEARTLTYLIMPTASLGHYDVSEQYAHRARELRREVGAEDDELLDALQTFSSRAYLQSEQYAKALPILLEQLEWRKSHRVQRLRVAETAAALAQCYARIGNFDRAQNYIEQVQDVIKHKKVTKPRRQMVLLRVADAFMAQGKYADALPLVQQVENAYSGQKSDKHFRQAEKLLVIADCHAGLGQYKQAERYYAMAFEIFRRGNRTMAGACLARWASCSVRQRDYHKAERRYLSALEILEKSTAKDNAAKLQLAKIVPAYENLLRHEDRSDDADKLKSRFSDQSKH